MSVTPPAGASYSSPMGEGSPPMGEGEGMARETVAPSRASLPRRVRLAIGRNIMAPMAGLILLAVVTMALLAPLLAPHDPNAQSLLDRLKPPLWLAGGTAAYPLGTDELGRDILSRIVYDSRLAIAVGVMAVLVAGAFGTLVGIVSGYVGGAVDMVAMRVADIQLAFPSILLALVVIAVLGPNVVNLVLVLGFTGWVSYARIVRSEVLALRAREFVVAAEAGGAGPLYIMRRHIFPNVIAPFVVISTVQVASVIIAEASLSYLGLGVPPDIVTWGGMLSEGQLYLGSAWWLATFPGLAIMATVLPINILGDVVRDVLDPKNRR